VLIDEGQGDANLKRLKFITARLGENGSCLFSEIVFIPDGGGIR